MSKSSYIAKIQTQKSQTTPLNQKQNTNEDRFVCGQNESPKGKQILEWCELYAMHQFNQTPCRDPLLENIYLRSLFSPWLQKQNMLHCGVRKRSSPENVY